MHGAVTQQVSLVGLEGLTRVMRWGVLWVFVLEGGYGWECREGGRKVVLCEEWIVTTACFTVE